MAAALLPLKATSRTGGMGSYFVYMLRCFDGTFYVGVTNVGEFEWIREAIDFEKKLKNLEPQKEARIRSEEVNRPQAVQLWN
jgi:predicted GIY-YIG superfamily endonuclease